MKGAVQPRPADPTVEGLPPDAVQPRLFERRPRDVRRFEAGLILGWWTIYGIWLTGQYLAFYAAQGVPVGLADVASRSLLEALVWSGITFVAFALSRRYRIDRRPRTRAIVVHVLAGAGLALAQVLVTYLVMALLGLESGQPFIANFFQAYPTNVVQYWLLVGVGHGLEYYRFYRQREAYAANLAARLANAELEMLKSQLHPHFLFNTLHAISALMHRDVKAADRMIARLSELLRASLEYTGAQQVSLQEELEFLEPYIEIEQVRLGDRLFVEFDIQPQVLDARVPHMILQPLVENAIRHGIAPRAQPGTIRISARGRRDMLDLEVLDDGRGLPPGRAANGGVGLNNTRARLEQLYGENFSFEPRNAPGGGFRVSLTIPFRPADDATPAENDVETEEGEP
ncbi:MAG: sensor histidine kinase [Longimicrobiales bacterium]